MTDREALDQKLSGIHVDMTADIPSLNSTQIMLTKVALTPTEAIAEEKALSYVDQIRARIAEIDTELLKLDQDFKTGKIDGDQYVEKM